MSMAFRSQTDGQTEQVNLVLQEYLRYYVSADQTDWADHISMVEFSYNNTKHSRTGFSLFMVVSRTEPLCRDPPPSPSLILTSLRVFEWLTSLTGGIHDDG